MCMFENVSLNMCLRSENKSLHTWYFRSSHLPSTNKGCSTGLFCPHNKAFQFSSFTFIFPFVGLIAPSNLLICTIIKTNNITEKPRIPLVWIANFWHKHSRSKNSVWFPNPDHFGIKEILCVSKKWNCQAFFNDKIEEDHIFKKIRLCEHAKSHGTIMSLFACLLMWV